jgi:hypothetical protein
MKPKNSIVLFLLLLGGALSAFSQVTIASEDFEGGGSWGYTPNPTNFNVGTDVWDVVSSVGTINAQGPGTQFWGVRDLANNNGGTATGTAGSITFANINTTGYTGVSISFDYNVIGFDGVDFVDYELVINGVAQGPVNLFMGMVGGVSTGGWVTQTLNIPGTPNTVGLIIYVTQNGGSDYAGFDNFEVNATLAGGCTLPPTAQASAPSITNVTSTSLDLSWTNGNGLGRIVVARQGSAVTAQPADSTTYLADPVFGNGADLGGGQYVVFAGLANSISLSGLNPGETYHFAIFEYNCGAATELYLRTAPAIGSTTTLPENVSNFDYTCITNNSATLSWNLPGSSYDGLIVFVSQGSTPADPTLDASGYVGANPNFPFAPNYGSGRFLVYKGNGSSLTVTGLTQGQSYTFKAFVYRNNTGTIWSAGTQRTLTAGLNEVRNLNGVPGDGQVSVRWTNPDVACFDEVLVVADESSGLTFGPSGNGTAYTANPVYGAPGQVVYKGTGNQVTVSGLNNGTTYCFEVYIRQGFNWSLGQEVCVTPGIDLFPGDLIIVGFDNNIGGGVDRVVLTNLVEIPRGTSFSFANACYELNAASNVRTGLWYSADGNVDSTIASNRLTYLGASPVAQGSIWCIDLPTFGAVISNVSINGTALAAGTDFSVAEDGSPNEGINFSTSNPDPIFLMQGSWTLNATHGTFKGRVLGGIMDGAAWYEVSDDLTNLPNFADRRRSRIPPEIRCFAIEGNSTPGDYVAYYGGTRIANWRSLVGSIVDFGVNWTANAGTGGNDLPANECSNTFSVFGGVQPGLWVGDFDNNWFDCHNWDNYQVPDSTVSVVVNGGANEARVDYNATYSDEFSDTARCWNLTLNGPQRVDISGDSRNVLEVNAHLRLAGTGSLDADDGNDNSLDGQVLLYGDWDNQLTPAAFQEGNSSLVLLGGRAQDLGVAGGGAEGFFRLDLNKSLNNLRLTSDVVIDAAYPGTGLDGRMRFLGGKVNANGHVLDVNVDQVGAISGYANNRYLFGGTLRRAITDNTAGYDFPVGTATAYQLASMDIIGTAGASDVDATFTNPLASLALTPNLIDPTDGVTFTELLDGGFWTLQDHPQGTFTGLYDLTLAETGFSNGGASHYTVVRRPNNAGAWSIPAVDNGFTDLATTVIASRNTYNTFSDFAIALDAPQAIGFSSIGGEGIENGLRLFWEFEGWEQVERFVVEQAAAGGDFKSGAVGQPLTYWQGEQRFMLEDEKPESGEYWYRVRAYLYNGAERLSTVVAIRGDEGIGFRMLGQGPNPVKNKYFLRCFSSKKQVIEWSLYSGDGKRIWKESKMLNEGINAWEYDLSQLPQGLYFLNIRHEGGRKTSKILKQ